MKMKYTVNPGEPDSIFDLDTYSADGQLIGRIKGYLHTMPANAMGEALDPTDPESETGIPRLLIDGHGDILQAEVIIPENALDIDFPGRRATLHQTLAELRETPHIDFDDPDAPLLNAGTAHE